ncbi:unnamed protein product [marine sediment metagenome]|jgi:hypothetical protein|uniref:Uncharacterized protein n=1 Tax=marine sediment metagenome TaxID=412755 RepID=X0ZNN9_9ZZZZ
MGFDLIRDFEILSEKDRKILEDICIKNNVSLEEMEKLLMVEKVYHLIERRYGIYENLKRVLEEDDK